MADDAMWCLVMFDLPVETKEQRREATRFRHDLLDWGFIMVQFSVYAKYWPYRWAGPCCASRYQNASSRGRAGACDWRE